MIGTRGVHGDAKLGTQERGTDLGNKAEMGVKSMRGTRPVGQLMNQDGEIALRTPQALGAAEQIF